MRPGIVIGFTEEFFQKTRPPGSSKKSFGLKADGKLLRDQTQVADFCAKFVQSDVIGAGICYISQKIFFTKNGALLGKPFDLSDFYPLFASFSLSSPNDSVTLNFEANFMFDLKDLVNEEKLKFETEIENEPVDCRDVFKLVKDYLETEGYYETLIALEANLFKKEVEKAGSKLRSYSGMISERYDSINIDPSCENCETFGKLCKFCVKRIMENVEPGNSIRLPEARNRCDSVDVSSLYLVPHKEEEPVSPTSPVGVKDVKVRGSLRKLITAGSLKEALTYLTENFPEMLNDELCMLYFNVQEFIELIKLNEPEKALFFAREKLARYKDFFVYTRDGEDKSIYVWEVVGLLAYKDALESPLSKLLGKSQLELTADLVNTRITQRLREGKNSLETLLKHLITVQTLYQNTLLMNKVEKVTLRV